MRILWVARGGGGEDAGDAVYDRKMAAALGGDHNVELLTATRIGRAVQLLGAALRASAPEVFAFGAASDVERIAAAARAADALVFSHEHLDRLAAAVRRRLGMNAPAFITIRHNVTSDAMRSILAGWSTTAGAAYAALARRQERATLGGDLYDGIVALSVRDRALLSRLSGRSVALASPGAPPDTALTADAQVAQELVLLGTYDWFPKARDLRRFLAELPEAGAPAFSDSAEMRVSEPALGDGAALDYRAAIRFGVVTDRFTAGHKLKTSAYIMQNCIVLSYADVGDDFAVAPDAEVFIRRIGHAREIAPVMREVAAMPAADLRTRFLAFKAAVAGSLSWPAQAQVLRQAIEDAVQRRGARGAPGPAA